MDWVRNRNGECVQALEWLMTFHIETQREIKVYFSNNKQQKTIIAKSCKKFSDSTFFLASYIDKWETQDFSCEIWKAFLMRHLDSVL